MNLRQIDDGVVVTGQIAPADVASIAAAGFRSIICNRPDHEEAGQPTFADVAKAAAEAGLSIEFVPVRSGAMTADDVVKMAAALEAAERPTLAYCRSGARSANIYGMATAK
jgi:uncharacterized protein (TIGR01244 family)